MSSLIKDIRDSFNNKGLEYVSMVESPADQKKTVLTYKDGTGKKLTKEIAIPLADLEETVAELDAVDPEEIADYLLTAKPQ